MKVGEENMKRDNINDFVEYNDNKLLGNNEEN